VPVNLARVRASHAHLDDRSSDRSAVGAPTLRRHAVKGQEIVDSQHFEGAAQSRSHVRDEHAPPSRLQERVGFEEYGDAGRVDKGHPRAVHDYVRVRSDYDAPELGPQLGDPRQIELSSDDDASFSHSSLSACTTRKKKRMAQEGLTV
jgi:hypothetical protein